VAGRHRVPVRGRAALSLEGMPGEEARDPDEEIGEALADMLEDDSLDTDTVNALADRLGVEIPEREYEVDVTITISRTIRVKAANREAAHSLATGDTSFMNASLQVDDSVTIEGDVDIEVQDDGAGYGDVNVNVADITRV